MAVTSGFFNSKNGDRTYDAEEMSSLFAGIIKDGIFANYPASGDQLVVSANPNSGPFALKIGPGRAWFNNVWLNNDNNAYLSCESPSPIYPRVDSVYICVDKSNDVFRGRRAFFQVLTGTAEEHPSHPEPTPAENVYYYRIADISIPAAATELGTIVNLVGREGEVPFITGPLETISAEGVLAGWKEEVDLVVQAEVDQFMNNPASVASSLLRVVPAIWLCDHDIPSASGATIVYSNDHQSPVEDAAMFYPDFYNDPGLYVKNRPKAADVVLGANGYYGQITFANVESDRYSLTIKSTGKNIFGDVPHDTAKVFEFTLSGIDAADTTARTATSPDVSCSATWPEIQAAYQSGYVLRAKVEALSWREHTDPENNELYVYPPVELIIGDGDLIGFRVRTMNYWNQISGIDVIGYSLEQGSLIGWYEHAYTDPTNYLNAMIPKAASVDSTGLVSFTNTDGDVLFTFQLPLYDGSTEVAPR